MGHSFLQKQLAGFEFADAPLISCDHRRAASVNDPVEKTLNFPIDFSQLFFNYLAGLLCVQSLLVPRIAERSRREVNELFRRRDRFEHFLKRTFYLCACI
ncbi:MAG: hypothetical protein ACKVOJ_09885 [Sphingomonadaceae bacterium]